MKYIIYSILGIAMVAGVVSFVSKPVDATLTISWTCKLATFPDGTGTSETWGNLRKPIYFTETQLNYIIERENDTIIKPNFGAPSLPYKYMLCTR